MKDLSLNAARRQKRLLYWKEWFLSHDKSPKSALSKDEKKIFSDKISTYSLLISKMLASSDVSHVEECEQRITAIERELTSLFEERRLLTSDVGLPSVTSKYS